MKNEFEHKLLNILQSNGVAIENIKPQLYILLNDYDVEKKTTDIVVYDNNDYNEDIIKRFLLDKRIKGLTQRTLIQYKNTLIMFFNNINKPFNLVGSDDIKTYLAYRQIRDKVSDTTISNEWHVMSSFFGWMQKEEIIDKNPMNKVECIKLRKKKKKAFTSMECEKIRNGCETLREKAMVEVLFSTWCRVSEVAGMNYKDIDNDTMTVVGKGLKERNVFLTSKAILAIEKYLESRDDDNEALFVSEHKPHKRLDKCWIEKSVKIIANRVGVENCHPHRFRRTGATMALRAGMPIEKVSYILGHESVATTQIYLDINDEEVKQAHKKYVE